MLPYSICSPDLVQASNHWGLSRVSDSDTAVGDDTSKGFNFGAVFGTVRAVDAVHGDEAPTVQTELILGVFLHPSIEAVLSNRIGATRNGGKARKRPTKSGDAVTALAGIAEYELGRHPSGPRRHCNGNAVGGSSGWVNAEVTVGSAYGSSGNAIMHA